MRGASLIIILGLIALGNFAWSKSCSPRQYDQDSVVCVCNQTYCDTIDEIQPIDVGTAKLYETSRDGKRFDLKTLKFSNIEEHSIDDHNIVNININGRKQYQEIIGFGGAFTDAAGINIASLPSQMQETLIKDYYSAQGLEYNIGRIPMASCDFSTHDYSYDDVEGDFELKHFSLVDEDYKFKIPYIHQAQNSSRAKLLFFASPWSSPYWMKTSNNMTSNGTLKGDVGGKYYATWANYFVKFIRSYESHNVPIWGITAENEPSNGYKPNFLFQSLGFSAETQRDFIVDNLGPALEKAGYGPDRVKLMILDDQRTFLPYWADVVLANKAANKYVSGIAFHWYLNADAPASLLDTVHYNHPQKFIFASEACNAWQSSDLVKVALGSWKRAEQYAIDIIEDLNHWTTAWVDWNLALDLQGGPNWVSNFVDAPVIVDASKQEYYKQPMFYILGHFSKFISRKSVRIDARVQHTHKHKHGDSGPSIDYVAFKRPDGANVLVALNRNMTPVNLKITDGELGSLSHEIPAKSIQTYIWWHKEP